MNNNERVRKLVILSVLTAIALLVNIIESMIQLIPGTTFKIGFANIIILIVFYAYGWKEGIAVGLIRLFFGGLLSPSGFGPTFILSLSGGVVSILVIAIFKKINIFSIVAVSAVSSFMHVVGQLLAAIVLLPASIYYAPIMLALSIPAGIITGFFAKRLLIVGEPIFTNKPTEEDETQK